MRRNARLSLAITVLAFSGNMAPLQAQEQDKRSFWNHNGSLVYLLAKGNSRQFYYQKPRIGMIEAGARPDDLLFSGESHDGMYFGTAHLFNSRCGNIPYEVSGPILDNSERVVLKGKAPRFSSTCRITGYLPDTLEFTLLNSAALKSNAGASGPVVIPDLSGAWRLIGTDDRTFMFKVSGGTITIDANDLSCKIGSLKSQEEESFVGESECSEEGTTSIAKETLRLLHIDSDLLLVDAITTLKAEDDSGQQTYNNRPPVIRVYKKLQ